MSTVGTHERKPGPRGLCQGWTLAAARANRRWLMGRRVGEIVGPGLFAWACSFTVRDCPPTAATWAALVKEFFKAARRSACLRYHYVTELQRRGVPHLHAVLVFALGDERHYSAVGDWLRVASHYNPSFLGQHIAPVDNAAGWLQYLDKHAARGVRHYQRDNSNFPVGWQESGRLGRVWGKGGDWVKSEPVRLRLLGMAGDDYQVNGSDAAFYALRRRVRNWSVADYRSAVLRGRDYERSLFVYSRRMLRCGDEKLSRVRGLSRWVGDETLLKLMRGMSAVDLETGELLTE